MWKRGKDAALNSVNSNQPCTPRRSKPSMPTGSESQVTAEDDIDHDAQPDEAVPVDDNEDERMHPNLVDKLSQQAMQDEFTEGAIGTARFDETDDEEKEENADMLIPDEDVGVDMQVIEWNREDPKLDKGTTFESMTDCQNALTSYCLKHKYLYEIDKSEPKRLTVHCPYQRCRWRLHASRIRKSKQVQVYNWDCTQYYSIILDLFFP